MARNFLIFGRMIFNIHFYICFEVKLPRPQTIIFLLGLLFDLDIKALKFALPEFAGSDSLAIRLRSKDPKNLFQRPVNLDFRVNNN